MLTINNQPVVFNLEKSCLYPVTYKQLVNQGDVTSFQFQLENCFGSPQLLENSSFVFGLTSWTVAGVGFTVGTSQAVKTGSTTSLIRQSKLTIGRYYVAEVDVDSIFEEDEDNMVSVNFGVSNPVKGLYEGQNSLYGFCEGDTNFEIRCNKNSQIAVNSVNVYEITLDYKFIITDEQGVGISHFDLYQSTTPFFNSLKSRIDQGFVTIDVNWNDLSIDEGCYKIGVADACTNTNGQNGLFNNNFRHGKLNWEEESIAGTPTISYNNQLSFTSGSISAGTIDYLGFSVKQGLQYQVTYELSTVTNGAFRMEIGNQVGISRNAVGVYTENITASSDGSLKLLINILGVGGVVLDYVNLSLVNNSDYVSDFLSEPFNLKADHECTKLIRISNDVNAFGFNFSIFSPQMRIYSDFRAGRDLSDREKTRNSNGNKKVYFADVIFAKKLRISHQPEYIHNVLRYAVYSNYLYIDGESYFVEEDEYPDPSWNPQETEATVTMEVSKNELQMNRNCDGSDTGGDSGSSGLGSGSGSSSGGSKAPLLIGLDKDTILEIN